MKLIIKETGDTSVGIPERYYELDCPFDKEDMTKQDLDYFKIEILQVYTQFAEMKMEAFYDDEPTYDLPPELDL